MDDGGSGGSGGVGGDAGALAGPNAVPDDGNCIVVHPPDTAGIFLGPDGNSCVVLPRQPVRPEDDVSGVSDDPDGPPEPT